MYLDPDKASELLEEAEEFLSNVHTGTDDECEAWEIARKIRILLGTADADDLEEEE